MARENYKVVRIITTTQVVIDAGTEDGLKNDMRLLVVGDGGAVTNPENGEVIENLELVRGTGKILHAQKKISTLQSDQIEVRQKKLLNDPRRIGLLAIGGYGIEEETERIRQPFTDIRIGDNARLFG